MYSLLELNIKVWSCLYFKFKKKIERIKKKSSLSLSCILYTCISKIFLERDMIWLSTTLAAIILVLALSSPTFFCVLQSARPLQTLRAPKPLDFIIRQN